MSIIVKPIDPDNAKDVFVVSAPDLYEYQKILGQTVAAKDEALQHKINAGTEAAKAKQEADRAETEADRAKSKADDATSASVSASNQAYRAELKAEEAATSASQANASASTAGNFAAQAGTEAERAAGEAVRSGAEADRAKSIADDVKDEVGNAKTEADRAKSEADRAKSIADDVKVPEEQLAQIMTNAENIAANTEAIAEQSGEIMQLKNSKIDDVTINGTSIKNGTVAEIPLANSSQAGAIPKLYTDGSFGIGYNDVAGLYIASASVNQINNRNTSNRPITPTVLDYAVKSALCDGKGQAYTETEKQNARERLGVAIVTLTQAEYDALEVKSADTTYLVTESD